MIAREEKMKKKASIVLGSALCALLAALAFGGAQQAAAAERLPGVRMLGNISDKYDPVAFDHAKHVSLAGSCASCHHHGNGDTSSCKGCHGLSPAQFKNSVVNGFMPCSNCHGSFDRENPGMPGLKVAYHKKCFECHRGMGNIGLDPKGCTEMCHAKKTKSAGTRVQ